MLQSLPGLGPTFFSQLCTCTPPFVPAANTQRQAACSCVYFQQLSGGDGSSPAVDCYAGFPRALLTPLQVSVEIQALAHVFPACLPFLDVDFFWAF